MNTLLIFFALPVATIILAIVLEKIIRNPFLTAATFFAIFLVVTFAFFDETFLVNTIVYTLLAFIAAVIAEYFYRRCEQISTESTNTIYNCTDKAMQEITNNTLESTNKNIGRYNYRCFRK